MKFRVHTFLCISALLLLAGIFWIVPLERDISATNARARAALERAISDERALRDAPRVRVLARRIRATLDGVRLHATGSESSETLLHDIALLASHDRLTVTAIKPAFVSSASPPPFISSSSSPLAGARFDDFDVSVHGTYRDTVGFLRDLSHISTLTRVISLQVERSNESTSGDTPALDALIHVQTIRFDPIKPHPTLEEHTSCLFPCTAWPRLAVSPCLRSAS